MSGKVCNSIPHWLKYYSRTANTSQNFLLNWPLDYSGKAIFFDSARLGSVKYLIRKYILTYLIDFPMHVTRKKYKKNKNT